MNPYVAYIRSSLLGMLAYRMRYFTGILTYLLYVSIHYFIWKAVFDAQTATVDGLPVIVNGYTLSQMITYVTIAWISRSLCFSNIDYDIDDIVRTGQVSIYLLRPVHFELLMISQAFGEFLFRLIFFTIPIGLVIWSLFPIQSPHSVTDLILFLWSIGVAFLIMAQINLIVGLIAFFSQSISSLIQAKHYMLQLLSGLLLPLSFFPTWAESILQILPFQLITFIPIEFYLGKIQSDRIGMTIITQVSWILILALCSHLIWIQATKKVVLQGG